MIIQLDYGEIYETQVWSLHLTIYRNKKHRYCIGPINNEYQLLNYQLIAYTSIYHIYRCIEAYEL